MVLMKIIHLLMVFIIEIIDRGVLAVYVLGKSEVDSLSVIFKRNYVFLITTLTGNSVL